MQQAARIVSFILHPVFMPLLGIIIIFNSGIYVSDIPYEVKKYTYFSFALFTCIIPLSFTSLITYWKLIGNIQVKERQERFLPLLFTAGSFIALHFFVSRIIPVKLLSNYSLSLALVSITMLLINVFYKISLHTAGIGGLIGLLLYLYLYQQANILLWLAVAVFIAGIIGTARLIEQAHKPSEVYFGYLLGIITVSYILFRPFLSVL